VNDGGPESVDLRSRVLSGLAWKAASQIFLQFSRFAVALVLARLLTPHDWGLAAMVLVFSGFVIVFTDNALGTALIQRREIVEADRSTVFWVGVGIGVTLAAAGVALAGPVAAFYGEPDVEPLFAAMSLSFAVNALGTTQVALLVREMQFKLLELRVIVASLCGAVTGIVVALDGHGAWAIVIQQLTIAIVSTALLWRVTPWRPSATFSLQSLRKLGRFTANVFGQNLLYQTGRNLDNLLVGRFLGAVPLGLYGLAYNVMLVPFSRIAAPLQQVFFPAFSRMQEDKERMATAWIRVVRLVGSLSIPALVGLVIVAPDFVDVVLGQKWSGAVPLIQILAWAGILQSLQTLNGEILMALDRAHILFRFTVLWFFATIGAVALGLQWGIEGVAACYTIAIAIVEPLNAHLTARALGVPTRRFFVSLAGVVQATAVMALVTLTARELLIAQNVPASVRLPAVILLGMVVYLPCCLWRVPEVTRDVRGIFPRPRPASAVTTEP
jgi:O-antigen/teichoic acid export membrane protein